ncbi:MAG: prolipoprotein diacylglyceryl transferase [Opitutae bacterium]|nr:prolipoprotein diacylglyceryl transferase [Opitutae bacterium]
MNPLLGRLLYGVAFCVGVPLLLAWWAGRLDAHLYLPRLQSSLIGGSVAAIGVALMLRAMWDLWRRGGGLPMNAFPPPRLVTSGAYACVPHPIYVGFALAVPGAAVFAGSASGLWIVTPVVWLALVALVIGYERIDLQRRFGATRPTPWLALPANREDAPSLAGRLAAVFLAFGAWFIVYRACAVIGAGRVPVDTMLPFERNWPVWESSAVFYLGAYAWIGAAPFVARTQSALREFTASALWATAIIGWCFLAFPFVATPRAVDLSSFLGAALGADRDLDTNACALPSFHVFWALATIAPWRQRIGKPAAVTVAVAIVVSCVTTGAHSSLDVLAGLLVFRAVRRRLALWRLLRNASERVANFWRDWRIGPVRIINHGAYVGLAAATGVAVAGSLLGRAFVGEVAFVALCALLGAGAWGQWLEASSQLSRPFGYFGGLFGGALGVLLVHAWSGHGWEIGAAYAVAAPVIQAIGRLRCLAQGCCHGRPAAEPLWGIAYRQPLSRVCKLAKLAGVPIYPTPLYSILGNVAIVGLLARLWWERAETGLIVGAYLLLSTCARFVEEAYRGEPQTVRIAGLPIYQWLALGCFLVGIGLSAVATPNVPAASGFNFLAAAAAVPIGLLVWFAMGVDFPESNRRMSRLA